MKMTQFDNIHDELWQGLPNRPPLFLQVWLPGFEPDNGILYKRNIEQRYIYIWMNTASLYGYNSLWNGRNIKNMNIIVTYMYVT